MQGSSEGFEPEALTAMATVRGVSAVSGDLASVQSNTVYTPAPNNMIERLRFMRNGKAGAVDLRIVGSPGAMDGQRSR
jgi:hypothetical protein